MSDNREKVVLVTGSSRGLGRAMALEFAQQGYSVAVHYARSQAPAEAVAQEINAIIESKATGAQTAIFQADVGDVDACAELVKAVKKELGAPAILVNNAGVTNDTLALRMKPEQWQQVLDINLSAAFYLSKAVLRGMMSARWGRIINISSVVGLMGNAGQANYVAAKAGLIGLTKSLALEYAERNITVNAIAPGFISSDMTDALSDEVREQYLARIPLRRFGTADDVAKVVSFLASEAAAYMTGQTLSVDGGMVMH